MLEQFLKTNIINQNIIFFYLFIYLSSIFLVCILLFSGLTSTSNIFLLTKINLICSKKKLLFLLSILNLAGIPPLAGFFLKFKVCIFIILNYNILYFISFYVFIILSFFFYLYIFKNSREFFLNKTDLTLLSTSFFEKKTKKYAFSLTFLIIFFIFINLLLVFFFKDFFLLFSLL